MPTLCVVIWPVLDGKEHTGAPAEAVRTKPSGASTEPQITLARPALRRQSAGMLAWSPLLVQKIEIQALGFVLRKLQLNRHRATEVASHTHTFSQLILYLAGEGVQIVRDRRHEARAGDLFIIPPEVPHGFAVSSGSRPLCLVLDFDSARRPRRLVHRRLPHRTLNELHALLARVPTKGRLRLSAYPAILEVVARLLEPTPDNAPSEPAPSPLFVRVRDQLRDACSLTEIARNTGYARDSLSRKLKREHGLSLRGLRDQQRLAAAEQALRGSPSVAEAAVQAGFEDPNYFARWFRRRTGRTPSEWREALKG
jgi:AraC-like DNA-binding protein/mannose-6-phosphate isomerase-like protein (cupin superfamily)